MADGYIRVVDWSKHQHYKKRKPPWIKLYRDVLTDYEITGLEPWERWCLVGLWLLAAETDNEIPADLDWLRARLVLSNDPPLLKLESLGLIEVGEDAREMLAKPLSKAEYREETEAEKSIGAKAPLSNGRSTDEDPVEWMNDVWHDVLGVDGHPIKLTNERRKKYRLMYEEQLDGVPDPELAWRAVLHAVTKSEHHMSKRSYQMPESILMNESRRDRWVQEAISVLSDAPTAIDRKMQETEREVLEHLKGRRAA